MDWNDPSRFFFLTPAAKPVCVVSAHSFCLGWKAFVKPNVILPGRCYAVYSELSQYVRFSKPPSEVCSSQLRFFNEEMGLAFTPSGFTPVSIHIISRWHVSSIVVGWFTLVQSDRAAEDEGACVGHMCNPTGTWDLSTQYIIPIVWPNRFTDLGKWHWELNSFQLITLNYWYFTREFTDINN